MGNKGKLADFTGGGYNYPTTVWEFMKYEILAMIINGEITNGDKVTSISETAQKFKCGKSTAQKVLDNLCQENILYKVHGKGYYVGDINSSIENIKKTYMNGLDNYLLTYISMAQKIGWSKEEIVMKVKEML